MTKPANHIFEFGPFRVETAERLLLRAGARISVTPKAFETLLVLVQNSGRLVEKDDLMKRVWPDAIVEEANLARNVWALRKALGDGDGAATYIETIPKVGYRFVAPVTELPLLESGRGSQDSSPAFSPDGKSVAFISTSDGHPEVYFMNADGTGLVRVTHSIDEKSGPQFSADAGGSCSAAIAAANSRCIKSMRAESSDGVRQ